MEKPKKAVVIHPDRRVEEVEIDFEGCQKAVGGFVELVHLAPGVTAYVNEDGIAMGLPRNDLATLFCHRLGPNIRVDDYIKGTMVVLGTGGTQHVRPKTVEMIKQLAAEK